MKILMVNKFFYIKGGSETYYFSLKKLLEQNGHEVIDFSMQDDRNMCSEYSDYFVKNVNYDGNTSLLKKIKMAANIVYSFEAKKKFETLVRDTKPDIIHLHIFQHQISPSILDVIKKYNIPAVYTAHDLKMLCLNYKMMNNGRVCEKCRGEKYYHCALGKCVKNSLVKSCINMLEGYFHKWKKSYDVINTVITPSLFYKNKFIDFGVSGTKIVHIPNFLESDAESIQFSESSKNYYLYFGRLSEEKGVLTLIKAAVKSQIEMYIVGTGPLKESLENYIDKNKIKNVKILGFKSGVELKNLVGNSKAVILPSEWYENGPYSAIEALQLGRPLIGSDLGGIPELIFENKNGYIFKNKDISDLKKCFDKMENLNASEYQAMEGFSKDIFDKYYTSKVHYLKILKVYSDLII